MTTSKAESLISSKLFLLFSEIAKGYSKRDFHRKPIYIKHLGVNEKAFFDYRYQEFFNFAIKSGIPTEEEALEKAKIDDFWTEKEEKSLKKISSFIDTLLVTKKNLFKTVELKTISDQIDEERKGLQKKINERREILGKTAEEYASNRSNDYIIYESLFKDPEFKERHFVLEEFEEMTYEDLIEYILFYNEYMREFEEVNIQKISLMDFFQPYYLVLDKPTEFFGKPMIHLSDFQVRVTIYGKIFKNIFETNEHIPENIRLDPDALLSYVDKSKAKDKYESKRKVSGDAVADMVFGATKEDLQMNSNANTKNLNQIIKEKKTLNMEELMKLHGEG